MRESATSLRSTCCSHNHFPNSVWLSRSLSSPSRQMVQLGAHMQNPETDFLPLTSDQLSQYLTALSWWKIAKDCSQTCTYFVRFTGLMYSKFHMKICPCTLTRSADASKAADASNGSSTTNECLHRPATAPLGSSHAL